MQIFFNALLINGCNWAAIGSYHQMIHLVYIENPALTTGYVQTVTNMLLLPALSPPLPMRSVSSFHQREAKVMAVTLPGAWYIFPQIAHVWDNFTV